MTGEAATPDAQGHYRPGRLAMLLRQPFSVLGSLGLIGLIDDAVQWSDQIGRWIDAWSAFTRSVVGLLFWWIVEWFDHIPWLYDYVAMGLIVGGCATRAFLASRALPIKYSALRLPFYFVIGMLVYGVVWPASLVQLLVAFIVGGATSTLTPAGKVASAIFFESFIWAAAIIALNYALLR